MKTILLSILLAAATVLPTKADDSFGTAIAISPGETSGTITTTADVDYFKFTLSSLQYVSICTKASAIGAPATRLNVVLYDGAFTYITESYNNPAVHIPQILAAGTYYVRVSSLTTGNYRLMLSTLAGAKPLSPATLVDSMDVYNDEKIYKFSVVTGGLVQVRTRAATAATAQIRLNMVLRGGNGEYITESYNSTVCDIMQNLSPGDYYITLKPGPTTPNVGSYSLKLICPDNALSIGNGTHAGTFAMQGDQNYYKFQVEGTTARSVEISASGLTVISAILYTGNGAYITERYNAPNFNMPATLNPGTYHLKVTSGPSGAGSYGSYTFTLSGASIPLDPEIGLSYNSTNIPDNNISPTTAMGTYFGGSKVGSAARYRTYRITNSGTGTLNISRIAIEGTNRTSFKIATQPTKVLAPGQTTTFRVSFSPKVKGTLIATVVINNNDPNESRFDFRLKGIGQ